MSDCRHYRKVESILVCLCSESPREFWGVGFGPGSLFLCLELTFLIIYSAFKLNILSTYYIIYLCNLRKMSQTIHLNINY